MTEAILVITHFPEYNKAQTLAESLVEKQLAACINIFGPCTSIYRWQDNVETDSEIPVFIKTHSKHFQQVEALINSIHPYELPEVITVPIIGGSDTYLQWIFKATT